MTAEHPIPSRQRDPRNKGRIIGQKRPLKPKDVWTIRVPLQLGGRERDLAMFNLAIDSKLWGDLIRVKVDDVCAGGRVRDRATVIQKRTSRPVQLEITEQTRSTIGDWPSTPAGVDTCSRAVSGSGRISRRGSTPASSIDGWSAPVPIVRRTAHIRCAERRRLKFTRKPATCERYSCCSVTRNWKAPFAISGSRWMMRSVSRNGSNSERSWRCGLPSQGPRRPEARFAICPKPDPSSAAVRLPRHSTGCGLGKLQAPLNTAACGRKRRMV